MNETKERTKNKTHKTFFKRILSSVKLFDSTKFSALKALLINLLPHWTTADRVYKLLKLLGYLECQCRLMVWRES